MSVQVYEGCCGLLFLSDIVVVSWLGRRQPLMLFASSSDFLAGVSGRVSLNEDDAKCYPIARAKVYRVSTRLLSSHNRKKML